MDNSASRCVQKKSDRATLAQPRSVGGCVQSRMVAADARRIMEAKPFPPRYLGGYACCNDSWTHPAGSAGPGGANQFLTETVPMRDCPVGTFDNSPAF